MAARASPPPIPASSDPSPSHSALDEICDGDGHLDRLPDSLLLVIFSGIADVKSLGRCCAVSRRFLALVPLVDDVSVRVDCVIPDDPPPPSAAAAAARGDKARGLISSLARFVLKPFQALGQILTGKRSHDSSPSSSSSSSSLLASSSADVSHHSPAEVLANFKEIRRLKIELPAGELGVDDGALLKWKACFGSTLESCVILGALPSSFPSSPSKAQTPHPSFASSSDNSGAIPESFYTNGSLKLRVVWTISSLIAASARHFLLQPIIKGHETLESLELSDADGQGVLMMGASQLKELRSQQPVPASGSSQRTLVPALSMKLWYAPYLEIPGGFVLKGATLVAIRPSEERPDENRSGGGGWSGGVCWVPEAFEEEPYRTAARMLVKRRTYGLEMNSF